MSGCGKMTDVVIPTRYSAKVIQMRCGSTSIYGTLNLCRECEDRGVPNPPAYTYEDAGEEDFHPSGEW
jgi:rRNA maturation protein Nop10